MSSPALTVFHRLTTQIDAMRRMAAQVAAGGEADAAAGCLRSCIVLSVAALDTYMHEQGVRLLEACAASSVAGTGQVANYLKMDPTVIQGPSGNGLIRYRLSYKTLVAPEKIDEMLTAAQVKPDSLWMNAAINVGSRPDRLRRLLQLQVDRRNQIAHEGDWDPAAFDLRQIAEAHVDDCLSCIRPMVEHFDQYL